MKIQQQAPLIAAQPVPSVQLAAPAHPLESSPHRWDSVRREALDSADDWAHMGKKLGSLAVVSIGSGALTMKSVELLANAAPNLPMALFTPIGIAGSIACLAAMALEEQHVGVGRRLGGALGGALGIIPGAVKGLVKSADREPESIELKRQAPTGKGPYEPLLLQGSHALQKHFGGKVAARTRAVELGENIGATVGSLAVAYTIPAIASAIGGPIGSALDGLMGPLVGMVVGGIEENTLGIGRTLGELAGMAFSHGEDKPAPVSAAPPKDAGLFKKGFLKLNHVIGQPVIGFLVDTTTLANRMFAESPRATIAFADRGIPPIDEQRLLKSFVGLAGIYGPSGHEEKVTEHLSGRLDKLGFELERRPDNTLIGTLAATPGQEDSPTVMLSAHQDTVAPTSAAAIRVDHRKVYTDGSHVLGADDRAGIAEILEGVETVREHNLPHPEIKIVFTVDEERGLVGASRLRPEDISGRPTLGFVVDALSVKDVHLTNDAVIVQPSSKKYNFSQENEVVQVVLASMAQAGLKPRPIHAPILTGAGSDANTVAFNSGMIRSIAVGAGEQDMHTPLERIKIADLEQAARHVVGYITNSCDLKVVGDKIVPRNELTDYKTCSGF